MGDFVSRQDAAYAARVPVYCVKNWLQRGWLDSAGKRRHLRTDGLLVHIDDVLEAERDTRLKSGRSHRRFQPSEIAA